MSSWPHARSRSRTSHRPRHQQAARLSRPSTTTQQPTHGTPSVPRGITGPHRPEPPAPERHVLTIINFQSFADLSSRREFTPDNVDFLGAECRLHLDAIEEISLYLLGADILITRKFPLSPFATYAILFPHEFAKLGTSVSQATLWNFVATILLVKLSKLMKNSASVKHWKLGFRDGVHGNNPHSIQNSFQYGPEGRLSGACHVTVKYPDSFYHDTIATAFKKKNSVNFRFSFRSLTFSPCLFYLLVLIFLSTLCIFCHSHIHVTFDHHQFPLFVSNLG